MPYFRLKWALIAILLVVLPFFFVGGPDWASGPLYRSVWNFGHILFFGLFTLALQLHSGPGGWRQGLGISLAVLVASLAIEHLQSYVDRQVDWQDILRNLIGAWLVLAWRQGTHESVRTAPLPARIGIWTGRAAVTALLALQLVAVAEVALQQYRIAQGLPLLSDFEDPRALRQWSGNLELSRRHSVDGGQSLAINLQSSRRSGSRYSGVSLNNMPRDWRGYDRLSFQLYNPDPIPLALTLRINDQQHDRGANAYDDRFNTRLLVAPGWNRYRIDLAKVRAAPASRPMDMDRVRRLGLFTTGLERSRTVFLDDLRLQ